MNFIKLYVGDYQRDTGHLSIAEHGAYLLMLQHYYATEKPLPTGKPLHRLLRAETKEDREAIESVAKQFWIETQAGLINERADEEIQKAAHQRTVNQEIGRRGGRPKKTDSVIDSETDSVNGYGTEEEPNRNPNQTPDTIEMKATPSSAAKLPTCPVSQIIDLYHTILPSLPAVRLQTDGRKKSIRKVWEWVLKSSRPDGTPRATSSEEAVDWFRSYFERATENDFLMGRTNRTGEHANWRCDLDFLLTEKGMKHVIEKTNVEDRTR